MSVREKVVSLRFCLRFGFRIDEVKTSTPIAITHVKMPILTSGRRMYSRVSVLLKSIRSPFTRSGPMPVGCCSYICQQV